MKTKIEVNHTPGPWKASMVCVAGQGKGSIYRPWITTSDGDLGICEVFVSGSDGQNMTAEDRANVRLIAAAPELLQALKALFSDYKKLADSGDAGNWKLEDVECGKKALEAIAKAEGHK